MKPKYFFFLFLTLTIIHQTSSIATIRYVSKTGTSTPPYTSWETASDSIQKCINICVDGDTIYVANGVYYESIYIDKTINLWGSSMDSTVIDATNNTVPSIIDFYENNSTMKNFYLTNSVRGRIGINTNRANLIADHCRTSSLLTAAMTIYSSSVKISNFIINVFNRGILDECFPDTCHSVYTNNVIILFEDNTSNTPVNFLSGGYPTFVDNILIQENSNRWNGIYSETSGAVIKNNLIAGFYMAGLRVAHRSSSLVADTIYNNLITDMDNYGIETGGGSDELIKNNIFQRNKTALITYNTPSRLDNNLFWKVQNLVAQQPFIGDSNIIADPMFVKDTIPSSVMDFDFHLQKYSPAINAGDPNILDKDGTRSDIGIYGGALGETYTYQDLAPLAPRHLSAVVDTNSILVKWNRNTEADTAFYKVYRDTVINFTIDSTKLVSAQTDTFFVHLSPFNSSKYVYKISCVDNQGNESKPSIELVVNITSVSMNDYPMIISDYILYQNYPNPFNPSTKIGYQLKERSNVRLMIYDIKGELISVLVNKEQTAGYYEVEFNVGNGLPSVPNIPGLASGIYLYRIEVIGDGDIPVYTEMKKMLMLK
jgi:hypothetical protein